VFSTTLNIRLRSLGYGITNIADSNGFIDEFKYCFDLSDLGLGGSIDFSKWLSPTDFVLVA